jgi:lysophospholipase L1-like esterase
MECRTKNYCLLIIAILISFTGYSQKAVYGLGTLPIDTGVVARHFRVDSTVKLLKYATPDSNKVIGLDAQGNAVLRTKQVFDTTGLLRKIDTSRNGIVVTYWVLDSTNSKNIKYTDTVTKVATKWDLNSKRDTGNINISAPANQLKALFWGNSMTKGTAIGTTSADSAFRYSTLLCKRLGLQEVNNAISGSSLMWETPTTGLVAPAMINNLASIPTYSSDIAFGMIMYGINDIRQNYVAWDSATFRVRYNTILDTFVARGWTGKIIMSTTTYCPNCTTSRQNEFNTVIRSIATQRNIPLLEAYNITSNTNYNYVNTDGIHINAEANKVLTNHLSKLVTSTVYANGHKLAVKDTTMLDYLKLAVRDTVKDFHYDAVVDSNGFLQAGYNVNIRNNTSGTPQQGYINLQGKVNINKTPTSGDVESIIAKSGKLGYLRVDSTYYQTMAGAALEFSYSSDAGHILGYNRTSLAGKNVFINEIGGGKLIVNKNSDNGYGGQLQGAMADFKRLRVGADTEDDDFTGGKGLELRYTSSGLGLIYARDRSVGTKNISIQYNSLGDKLLIGDIVDDGTGRKMQLTGGLGSTDSINAALALRSPYLIGVSNLNLKSNTSGNGNILFGANSYFSETNNSLIVGSNVAPSGVTLTSANKGYLINSGANSVLTVHSSGGSPLVVTQASNGTTSSPTGIVNGTIIGQYTSNGYDGVSQYRRGGELRFTGSETWSNTATGTTFSIQVAKNGTTTRSEVIGSNNNLDLLLNGSGGGNTFVQNRLIAGATTYTGNGRAIQATGRIGATDTIYTATRMQEAGVTSGIIKADANGVHAIATPSIDYVPPAELDSMTGWASYVDNAYTSGSPFVVTAGNTDTLENNAATSITNQLPLGVTAFYNATTKKITPARDGDWYNCIIRFKAKTTANNDYFTIYCDVDGTVNEVYEETIPMVKGAGNEHLYTLKMIVYSGSTFVANGGTMKITAASGDLSIYDISYSICRTHRAR